MSFIMSNDGRAFNAGYFLATEVCTRETREIPQAGALDINGRKIMPAGTIFPSNDTSAVGILYEDVDVTSGNMAGSVVTSGVVYESRLPDTLDPEAKTALEKRFTFVKESEIDRGDEE